MPRFHTYTDAAGNVRRQVQGKNGKWFHVGSSVNKQKLPSKPHSAGEKAFSMPVLAKADHAKLKKALKEKVDELDKMLAVRDLKSNAEGCAKSFWPSPDAMGATYGTTMEIGLAADAVIALIKEIKKIK
jgi:hypothetical protein